VALRDVSLKAVRARLAERAQDWWWSSTRAHLRGKDDGLIALAPIKDRFPHLADLLASEPEADLFGRQRAARERWPAARKRSLSHRAADGARPQTRQAWSEAAWTAKPLTAPFPNRALD
jgi:hypothetical protein